MMRTTHERAALLLQVDAYDLGGVDQYKLMLVWQEDRNTIHEVHLNANEVYACPQAGHRVVITYRMDTPLRVNLLLDSPPTPNSPSEPGD